MSATERRVLARWWLERFDDATIAGLALGLGVEDASIERVAASRSRLAARPESAAAFRV